MASRPPAWHLLWLPAAHRAAPQSPCVTFWADPTPGAALVSSASGPQLPSCSGPSQTLFRLLSHASSWVVPPRVPLSWHSAQAGYMSAPPSSNLTPQQGLLGRGHPPACPSGLLSALSPSVLVAQSCPTLCDPMDGSPWNSPAQNTGVGSLALLQGIFPTQGSNTGLLHCRRILYQLSHQESPLSPFDLFHILLMA